MLKMLSGRNLEMMLANALKKESELWKPFTYKHTSSVQGIGPMERKHAVRWLVQLTRKFQFSTETLALSISILDRFLQAVKARPRHLNCIGVAAFYLAAKTIEEDQVIPGTLDLVQGSHCGCSMAEVLRMERCILDKLNWDLRGSTAFEFLHIFHALFFTNYPQLQDIIAPMTPAQQMTKLLTRMQAVLMEHRSLSYSPSTLALAVFSLELENHWPAWFTAPITLQNLLQVEVSEVIGCRELVASVLKIHSPLLNSMLQLHAPTSTAVVTVKSKASKRKVDELTDIEEEEDDIYDGIKRLYNEEEPVILPALSSHNTCGTASLSTAGKAPQAMTVAN